MTHIFFSNPTALPPEDRAWFGLDLAWNAGLWAVYSQSCPAAIDVLKERCRQVQGEGHSARNDDGLADSQLSRAAVCYLRAASFAPLDQGHRLYWPFPPESYKPSRDARRNLVKAAALILAEIERLDRAEAPAT